MLRIGILGLRQLPGDHSNHPTFSARFQSPVWYASRERHTLFSLRLLGPGSLSAACSQKSPSSSDMPSTWISSTTISSFSLPFHVVSSFLRDLLLRLPLSPANSRSEALPSTSEGKLKRGVTSGKLARGEQVDGWDSNGLSLNTSALLAILSDSVIGCISVSSENRECI